MLALKRRNFFSPFFNFSSSICCPLARSMSSTDASSNENVEMKCPFCNIASCLQWNKRYFSMARRFRHSLHFNFTFNCFLVQFCDLFIANVFHLIWDKNKKEKQKKKENGKALRLEIAFYGLSRRISIKRCRLFLVSSFASFVYVC